MSPYKDVKSWQMRIGNGEIPDIYDSKVVYNDDTRIKLYDINTKKTMDIGYSRPGCLNVWNTKVVWSNPVNQEGYIGMYDTSTKKTIYITQELGTDPYGNEYGASTGTHISIQGDKIVYNKCVDDYEGVAGVYVYNIASGKSVLLYHKLSQNHFEFYNWVVPRFNTSF